LLYGQRKAELPVIDPTQPARSAVFQVQHRLAGDSFQAQFFRDRKLIARVDLPKDFTVGQVRVLSDQWFAAFDRESAGPVASGRG